MKTLISTISAVSALVLVASCGGGGDGPAATTTTTTTTPTTTTTSADVADKYVGAWGGCSVSGNSSERETIAFSKQNATTLGVSASNVKYAAAGCSGTPGTTTNQAGTLVLGGTATIGTSTVDKGVFTTGLEVQKQVFLATATTLLLGRAANDGGPVDADGYPTTLDSGPPLTRQ